ncbi:MAG TPA: aminoacyl-histidine dipeptidase [Bacteroidetes bacterium]|nr:aminoacyl-histidine dipeptidase [Bacteroidota bacterium]
MSVNLLDFKPQVVWKHFDAIRQIPRESKHEKAAGDYVVSYAKEHNFGYERDEVGNVVVRVPATPGHESAATVILQGHLDMVCEKNSNVNFDFAKDAIRVRQEGDWLYAQGTTLGADNGIGVAAALALGEDPSVVHGPLELLFTIDEETGLTGAARLKPDFLKGEVFLNLDSEEEGIFTIGCAGGADTQFLLDLKNDTSFTGKYVKIAVSGLKGGHSGIDIDKNRGNALKFMVRLLWPAMEKYSFRLADIQGGSKRNAIPREIFAELIVAGDDFAAMKKDLGTSFADLRFEYKSVEKNAKLTIEELNGSPKKMMDETTQKNLLNFLFALPHGVLNMSADIPDLVETSANLATIKTGDDKIEIGVSTRSSVNSALEATRQMLCALADLAQAQVDQPEGYPGWTPNLDSKILTIVKKTYETVAGKKPEVQAIHAGLECGIIGENYPGMDMISLGPQIESPHSPDERVHIPSVENFWHFLKETLKELA